ncbi:hypothetical protein [Gimesia panareensis]|uniref:hypothetical protein n=1 Tax=Gimesia panareensis TaxID=2527978 RepID=UPI00119DFF82|nr:hypothetical protein [Gimesia panareensis]
MKNEGIFSALYPSAPQNSISFGFPQEKGFQGIGARANLATGFQIAYTNREANKDPPRYDTHKTHFNFLKSLFLPGLSCVLSFS